MKLTSVLSGKNKNLLMTSQQAVQHLATMLMSYNEHDSYPFQKMKCHIYLIFVPCTSSYHDYY